MPCVHPAIHVRLESSAFACEDLHVRRLRGREAISQLFEFEVELASKATVVDLKDILGATVDLTFSRDDVERSRVHGIVLEADDLLDGAAHPTYRLRIAPRAALLGFVETLDVFLATTVPAIVERKLALNGLSKPADVELRLHEAYPERELIVQYAETDLAFISRLTEHLGVSFFFEHKDGRDVIVLTDHPHGFTALEAEPLHYRRTGGRDGAFRLERRLRMVPGSYWMRDYNYRLPQIDLTESFESALGHVGGVVEFGANFKTPDEGRRLARVRAGERECQSDVYVGQSDDPALRAGSVITLEDAPDRAESRLLVVEVDHEATQVVFGEGGGERPYENRFKAIPASMEYRPPRLTPKPKIHGLVTGIIEDPTHGSGEYAALDAEGRYTVRFLFDTAPKGERRASHPVRMAQAHAGAGYGHHFPLKPGVEVVIGFVNGDPDRPVILGAVPNPLTPSPVTNAKPDVHAIRTASGTRIECK